MLVHSAAGRQRIATCPTGASLFKARNTHRILPAAIQGYSVHVVDTRTLAHCIVPRRRLFVGLDYRTQLRCGSNFPLSFG